jgi:hypothetical protein
VTHWQGSAMSILVTRGIARRQIISACNAAVVPPRLLLKIAQQGSQMRLICL